MSHLPAIVAFPMVCLVLSSVALLRHDAFPASALAQAGSFDANGPSALRCSGRNMGGVGLKGDYFAHVAMQGEPLLSRVDGTVEFDASFDWPIEKLPSRPRAARWQGWVKVPLSGRYRFHGGPSAAITVSALPMAGPLAAPDATLDMAAGSFYPIVMEVDLTNATHVRLEWTAPHGLRYVIPRALLFLPTS
ncbi:MAG: hypothetical protein H7Y33_19780 [Cytophagales bacterium]|nr:hypothetical protein [Rhizobacter sp.]